MSKLLHSASGYEPTSHRTIPFNGEPGEWSNWSFKYKALAAQLGFLNVIISPHEESVADPTEDTAAGEISKDLDTKAVVSTEDKAKKSTALYYNLVTSVEGEALRIIKSVSIGDGKAAWTALENHYQANNEIRKAQLQGQLFDPHNVLKEGGDAGRYLDHIEDLRRSLADIGLVVPDDLLIGIIKRGLPRSFESLMAVLCYGDQVKSYKEIVKTIRLYADDRKHQSSPSVQDDAFFVGTSSKNCFKCGKHGHFANECRSPSLSVMSANGRQQEHSTSSQSGKPKEPFDGDCANCGQHGHKWRDCRKPFSGRNTQAQPDSAQRGTRGRGRGKGGRGSTGFTAQVQQGNKSEDIIACVADVVSCKDIQGQWCVDTMASAHLTPFLSDFGVGGVRPYRGTVRVANDQIEEVTGVGTVCLVVKSSAGTINLSFEALLVPGLHPKIEGVSMEA